MTTKSMAKNYSRWEGYGNVNPDTGSLNIWETGEMLPPGIFESMLNNSGSKPPKNTNYTKKYDNYGGVGVNVPMAKTETKTNQMKPKTESSKKQVDDLMAVNNTVSTRNALAAARSNTGDMLDNLEIKIANEGLKNEDEIAEMASRKASKKASRKVPVLSIALDAIDVANTEDPQERKNKIFGYSFAEVTSILAGIIERQGVSKVAVAGLGLAPPTVIATLAVQLMLIYVDKEELGKILLHEELEEYMKHFYEEHEGETIDIYMKMIEKYGEEEAWNRIMAGWIG